MVKTFCDSCGTESKVGRFTVSMAVSGPLTLNRIPKYDADLCLPCLQKTLNAIEATKPKLVA